MRHLAALLILLSPMVAANAAEDAQVLARGRELSTLFLTGKTDAIYPQMAPGMQNVVRGLDGLAAFRKNVGGQLGEEVEVLSETVRHDVGFDVYLRTSRWSKVPDSVLMEWAIDPADRVEGFGVRTEPKLATPAPTTYLDYQTKAKLRLPFDGEWRVFWGGRTAEQNYHVVSRGQRFAYDMLVLRDGKSHHGDGAKPEDYFCWNQPIRAPADGTVATAVDGLPDQMPGTMDAANPPGNHVVLDLCDGEFALLAHLRKGSVAVKPGDTVEAGDELGRCGNSGNTSEPHLHFHLQDKPKFGEGDGLPAFFNDYVADGKPVARGEPVKGQTVSPK